MSHDPSTHEWGVVRSMSGPRSADGPASTSTPRTDTPATRVNAFAVGETYLLRQYFDAQPVFDALEPYYNRRRYRFEVPADDFDDVAGVLSGHGYDLRVVDELDPYAVVVRKYRDHPEAVFEHVVLEVSTGDHNVFVLADEDAVEAAVAGGATRLVDTPLRLRLSGGRSVRQTTISDVVADAD